MYSDGFSSMVQPAASAGATLQAIWFSGQFHGRDHADDANRLLRDHGGVVRLVELVGLQHVERGDEVTEAGTGLQLLGHRQRSAHFVGDRRTDIRHAGLVDRDDLFEQRDALFTGGLGERLESALGSGDSLVDVGLEPSAMSYIASSVAGLTTGVVFLTTGSTQAPSM